MFDFFEQVLGFIESFFEFFVNFCESLFTALGVLLSSITFPLVLSGYLPSILGSCVVILTSLAVVKFIVGR